METVGFALSLRSGKGNRSKILYINAVSTYKNL
jgi:hypothetical protein